MTKCQHVRGVIVLQGTSPGLPIPGLSVRLGHRDRGRFVASAATSTDEGGRFSFDLEVAEAGRVQGHPYELKVFDGTKEIEAHGTTTWPPGTDPGFVTLCAVQPVECPGLQDEKPANLPAGIVHGWVRHVDGTPVVGVKVELRRITFSGEVLVAEAITRADPPEEVGWYSIETAPSAPPETVGFVVRVFGEQGTNDPTVPLIGSSKGLPTELSGLRVDIEVCDDKYRRPPEFTRLSGAMDTILGTEGAPLPGAPLREDLDLRGIAILSGRTGWDVERIALWALAHKFQAEVAGADAESVYGLMRMGFPRTRDGILARSHAGVDAALQRAARRNIISQATANNSGVLVANLKLGLAAAMGSGRADTLGQILLASGRIDATAVSEMVALYASHEGPESEFWTQAAALPSMDATKVDEARRLVTWGTLALSNARIVARIVSHIDGNPSWAYATDTVGLFSAADWEAVAESVHVDDLPKGLEGDSEEEQRAYLAELLAENAEIMFPSQRAAAGLKAALDPGDPLYAYLDANPDFDIATAELPADSPDPDVKAARVAQRLYRIGPSVGRPEAMAQLYGAGVTSAWSVVSQGRSRFVAASGSLLGGEDVAQEVFANATAMTAVTSALLMRAHPRQSIPGYGFLPQAKAEDVNTGVVPDWETLFGNLDYCACEHCRSVIGPAAYLVDILNWLDARPTAADPNESALVELKKRRPDLVDINLSCENTNRALPYVDLVLEVLENAVASGTGAVTTGNAYDTTAETPELLAAPQYVNDGAYATLAQAATTKAMTLPFHRPLAEMRAFLSHLGVARADLMRTFRPTDPLADDWIAAEQLALSEEAAAAIEAEAAGAELGFWPVSALSELQSVPTLCRAGGIAWPDVLDLLHARYVNPRGGPDVLGIVSDDPCDIDAYEVHRVDANGAAVGDPEEPDWRRIRQFIRLWRATGWSILEVDKVLHALGIDADHPLHDAGSTWRQDVADVQRLSALTGLGPVEVVSWRGAVAMDTWDDRESRETPVRSLFDQVFRSPTLVPAGDTDDMEDVLDLIESGQTVDLLPVDGQPDLLDSRKSFLQAAVGIDAEDFDTMVAAVPAPVELTLANVSALYRWVSIARAAGLSPSHAVALSELSGSDPAASPAAAIEFLEHARDLQATGWSVDEVRYLTRHEAPESVGPTDGYIQALLGKVRDALRAAFGGLTPEATEEGIRDAVARILAEGLGIERAALDELRVFEFPHLPAITDETEFVVAGGTQVAFAPLAGADFLEGSSVVLTADADVDDGQATWTLVAGSTGALAATGNYPVLGATLPQRTIWTRMTVAGTLVGRLAAGAAIGFAGSEGETVTLPLGTELVLPDGRTVALVEDTAVRPAAGSRATLAANADFTHTGPERSALTGHDLVQRFVRTGFVNLAGVDPSNTSPWSDIAPEGAYADDFRVIHGLFKAALLLRKLNLDADERAFWYGADEAWVLPPVTELAGDASEAAGADFAYAKFRDLAVLFALRSRVPGSAPSFAQILSDAAAGASALAAGLSERTGWNADDIEFAAVPEGGLAEALTLTGAPGLRTLLDRMDIVRRVGASAETATGWNVHGTEAAATAELAREVVFAARSRYADPRAWSEVARPVRDVLRKAQRDALVTYLVSYDAAGTLADADDLYEKYLIDVSMNPEMLTSRIKQAACSVQLFVHRCLFGLEIDAAGNALVDLNDEEKAQWEWMRTYRVWEAARKVFLYPENWIEPELRDDRTSLFRSLESELAQGDITDERVEQAVLDYLDRLREVSNLQVIAYYVQKEEVTKGEPIDVLHVFARTRSQPASYWYRRLVDGATWRAWEPVDCGIEGAILAPVVHNRRLLLFWAVLSEASSGEEGSKTYLELRLAWSEYRDRKWSPKRLLEGVVTHEYLRPGAEEDVILRTGVDDDGDLVVSAGLSREPEDTADDDEDLHTTGFRLMGEFTFDACTQDAEVSTDTEFIEWTIPVETVWNAPSFRRREFGDLWVEWADTTEEGEVVEGTSTSLALLEKDAKYKQVVPHQYFEFGSQAPFFVRGKDRAWFVLPYRPEPDDSGAVEALALNTAGTWVESQEEGNEPDEDDFAALIEELLSYIPESAGQEPGYGGTALTGAQMALDGYPSNSPLAKLGARYTFSTFYHPYVCTFIEEVRRGGVFALLDPDPNGPVPDLSRQQLRKAYFTDFSPTDHVATPHPVEDIDFSGSGAYAQYNWELFFHLPFYVANRLADQGRHDEALRWFHTIFDPRTRYIDPDLLLPPPEDPNTEPRPTYPETALWWKVKPLMEAVSDPVTDWAAFTGADGDGAAAEAFAAQVDAWRDDPFNPHLLARLRPGTYQKSVVMRYIDNLLAWGDRLFARDTIESINEATQLYVFARQILGDRPLQLEPKSKPEARTYQELADAGTFDEFGNVVLENSFLLERSGSKLSKGDLVIATGVGYTSYFCVPPNPNLFSYWDIVEDRLFKVRNGLNIEGVARSLPLFEPPIDPALLVRAAAAGVDIGTVMDSLSLPLPHYRFAAVLQRAQAVAGSVRALGGALLSALEKRDAEALALLRSEHELALLDRVKEVRERQVDEARASLEALQRTRAMAEARHAYYDKLIDKGWSADETKAAHLAKDATVLEVLSASQQALASILSIIPDFTVGAAWGVDSGGKNLSRTLAFAGTGFSMAATTARGASGYLTTKAAYERRKEDWKHQRALASKELAQLDKQVAAGQIRVEIAKKELRNHDLQIEHSEQVHDWMTSKFTNQELYDWMVGQISALYYQSFQLALSLAKKAQACFNHELGLSGASAATFVQPVHWDSLRKGLLAGERLTADLERMDAAYLDQDRREFELTKAVSLDLLDPVALVRLREDGVCWFELPEEAFDLDCPGHYFRRITSVGVTVACVSGPQSAIHAQLTLHASSIRRAPSTTAQVESDAATYPSIVTSGGAEDTGLFQPDLRDARYLPFERKGAVSTWQLRLSAQGFPQFDWSTISDVVVHLRYTARDGGDAFRASVESALAGRLSALVPTQVNNGFAPDPAGQGLVRGFSVRRDFPDEWYQAHDLPGVGTLSFEVTDDHLPAMARGRIASVTGVYLVVLANGGAWGSTTATVTAGGAAGGTAAFAPWSGLPNSFVASADWESPNSPPATVVGNLGLALSGATFDEADDVIVVFQYTVA